MRLVSIALILTLTLVPAFAQETTPEPTQELTPEVTPEATAAAFGNTFSDEGISFSYDPALWSDVSVVTYAGDEPSDAPRGFADAPYVQFLFYSDPPAPENLFDMGGVRVYRFEEVGQYSFIVNEISALGSLINTRSDLDEFMAATPNANDRALPFLPVMSAAQVIRARAQYVETDALSGISYVTAFQQAASPFVGSEFLYTFQGLSVEAQVYVTAVFRLNTDLFPAEPGDVDMDEFITNLQPYFAESIATLNAAQDSDFTPPLDTLDALVQSITING